MKFKGLTVIFVISVLLIPSARAAHENAVDSAWLVTPIEVDGNITYSNEWSDANSIDLILGTNNGRSPPFPETKLWLKTTRRTSSFWSVSNTSASTMI